MARALKVFKTHIGFHDLIVAAPSMKAAASAWNSDPRIFSQGFANRTEDEKDVKAALAEPGVVLRRPHGQKADWQVQPAAIAPPKLSRRSKAAAAKAATARRRKEAEEKKARAAADRQAGKEAKAELAEIERQEAELRRKRRTLQKKFHLHSVKSRD